MGCPLFVVFGLCFASTFLLPASAALSNNASNYADCNVLCPGGSCCEVNLGQFDCCVYSNGVCCADSRTCCPQNSRCISDSGMCEYPDGFEVALPLHSPVQDSAAAAVTLDVKQTFCPGKEFACPGDSTCCPMMNGSWGCCGGPNAVCCGDENHCCPQGTKCNNIQGTCDPVQLDAINFLSFPRLSPPRISSSPLQSQMSYTGVKCDSEYECPSETTCCRNTTGGFACCPMRDAVCCSDGLHCCPAGTKCDLKAERCVSERGSEYESWKPHAELNTSRHQLCPDGLSVCLDEQTCCKRSDHTWGCCPIPNAVCCSDGQHCCPAGFKCDLVHQTCVKHAAPPAPAPEVTCPNEDFRCAANTTCCALPNDEFACCPFPKAVCCSDMAHCCPEDTTCDIAGNRCVHKSNTLLNVGLVAVESNNMCPSGLVSCPGGTCCKNVFGIDACCPLPEATCCRSGYCCPKGTVCDDSTQTCSSVNSARLPPSANKVAVTLNESEIICPDKHSSCPTDQTCCRLKDKSYGCCPLEKAVCCSDGEHCCPDGYTCAAGGLCVRSVDPRPSRPILNAERMVPLIHPPIRGAHLPENSVALGGVVQASFCGGCAYEWLCCPDADGLPNRMCCPSPGSVCCADGLHCCPSGTLCSTDGQCIPREDVKETTFAIPLIRPNYWTRRGEQISYGTFADFRDMPATMATRAQLNPLFLLNIYYRENSHLHTVCPDRERYCALTEKCCPSLRHGYVCAPSDSVCCYPNLDLWCPSGHYCADGGTCKKQPGRFA